MADWVKKTLGQVLDEITERFPENVALIFKDQRISYKVLRERARALAKGFIALGIGRGDKVSIWAGNCPEWISTQLATAMVGVVLVPVNTRFRTNELEYILGQSDSTTLVMMDHFLNIDFSGMLLEICPEMESQSPGKLDCRRLPLLKSVIILGEKKISGTFSFSEVLAVGQATPDSRLKSQMEKVHPDDVIMFQYTSGTTAFPKGVMLSHDGVIRNAFGMGQRQTLTPQDRLFCPLPFFHVGGAVISTLSVITHGASMAFLETYDPGESLKVVQRERCTAMNGIETHFLMMYQHPDFSRHDVSSLKKGWAIGPAEVVRNIYEKMGMTKILNVYGISEASPNVTTTFVDDPLERRSNLHGLPHSETEVRLVNPATGETLPPGKEGEICVRGFHLMKGYYKKPEESAKAIDPQGWLHTGDFGLIDPETGYLKFTGRMKEMLRVGGENVSAIEVESFLLKHPKVKQAQVIGVPDARLTEVGMAYIELKEGMSATEEEILSFCQGKIANFKIPRYIAFVKDFPLTGSGKIQKFMLREQAMEKLKE
ncbi:MAG: AMP-binding protein, partial [Deltaproteobacteria bacterium]|nr:AMP-binding protein [Deltaproteobacteria bacterium]